jgi:festuclavine dehydrogenase
MAILLTGGTGKTSMGIARLLQDAHIPFLLTSRRGKAAVPDIPAAKFDWLDPSSFGNPFESEVTGGEKISAIYLIAPQVADPAPSMNAFIDYAVSQHSAKRFVMVGGTTTEPGGPHVGQVWQHLDDIGVNYCVLRPTWFMGTSP